MSRCTATICTCASHSPARRAHGTPARAGRPTIILVDDVLFSGRTCRAAMDALSTFGRPARIQFAVLVDRGHRELPIRADYVGKNLPTALGNACHVRFEATDGLRFRVDEPVLISDDDARMIPTAAWTRKDLSGIEDAQRGEITTILDTAAAFKTGRHPRNQKSARSCAARRWSTFSSSRARARAPRSSSRRCGSART